MKRISLLIGSALVIMLWLICLGCIAFWANHTIVWGSLIGIVALSGIAIIVFFQLQQKYTRLSQEMDTVKAAFSAISQNYELAAFDEYGKTLFTTHPHAYPHKKEFLRKFMMRVNPSMESVAFKEWVEDHQPGEALLVGGGNGLGQQQRWWLTHVLPMDPLLLGGRHFLLASIIEITSYLDGYTQLKKNYSQLEAFLDAAPFAIFYVNHSGHLVGMNTTFCQWLSLDKERALGQPLKEFIEVGAGGAEWNEEDSKIRVVSLKPNKQPAFKALWFPPTKVGGRIQASLLCRLDAETLTVHNNGKEDYLSQTTFSHAPIPAVMVEENGKIVAFNPAFAIMISEVVVIDNHTLNIGDSFYDLIQSSMRSDIIGRLQKINENQGALLPFEMRFEGGKIHTTAYISRLDNPVNFNQPVPLMMQFIDISEQKRLEQQFIQSQKMQAVGQLAGGIAHDFNNLLTAMIGFCDLLLQRYMPNDPSYMDVVQIKQNANRAANLVRQLLAFSRQQNLQPKVINITDTLAELSALLRRLIGAGIELQMIHGRDLWPVKVDASQLEQVIINLAVNARDAMQQGGTLVIRTGHYQCHRSHRVGHDMMPPGDYVLIEAIDTGEGISPENIEHIFEPFFSTKELGSGTGLGLSTVYGIVKQTGGFVSVESEVNNGTTFKIFLPKYVGSEQIHSSQIEHPTGDLTGVETILLVEDEDAVRLFSARALREKGYRVLEANSGEAALELLKKGDEPFDLLITDVVMPKMDGPTLSKKIRDMLPDTKTIFISGYTEDTFRQNLDDDAQIHFLPKPFTLKDLAAKVKEVLNLGRE